MLGVSEVRQTEIYAAALLVLELSAFELEMAIDKLKGHKSPGIDQIPAKLIKAGGRTIRSEIHTLLLILYGKMRNCLRSGRSQSLYLSIRMVIEQIVVIIEAYIFANYI